MYEKTLYNPSRLETVCESAFPGFAPRVVLLQNFGVASGTLLLAIEHDNDIHPTTQADALLAPTLTGHGRDRGARLRRGRIAKPGVQIPE